MILAQQNKSPTASNIEKLNESTSNCKSKSYQISHSKSNQKTKIKELVDSKSSEASYIRNESDILELLINTHSRIDAKKTEQMYASQ